MIIFRPVSRSVYDLANLKMFIFGGGTAGSAVIQRYDGTTRSTDGSTLTGGYATRMCAVASGNVSWIFSTGNSTQSGNYNGITHYNGSSTSVQTATLSEARVDFGASMIGTTAYIFGGINNGGSSFSSVQTYNGTTRGLLGTNLSIPIYDSYGATLGSTAYAMGGYSATTGTITYTTGAASGIASGNLASVKYSASSTTLGSVIKTFGGGTSQQAGTGRVNTIQSYDGSTVSSDSSTLSSSMGSSGVTTMSGYAYIFGGYNGAAMSAIQKYDGTTRSTESSTLASAQLSLTATTASSIIMQ